MKAKPIPKDKYQNHAARIPKAAPANRPAVAAKQQSKRRRGY